MALSKRDYEALAEFRYALRQFFAFSEEAAKSKKLTARQHQALLAIRGVRVTHAAWRGAARALIDGSSGRAAPHRRAPKRTSERLGGGLAGLLFGDGNRNDLVLCGQQAGYVNPFGHRAKHGELRIQRRRGDQQNVDFTPA